MAVACVGVAVNGVTAVRFIFGRQDDLDIKGLLLNMTSDAWVALGVAIAGRNWQRWRELLKLST